MISCQTLIQIIEKWAPKNLAQNWDNTGLAIGEPSKNISKVLLTLTITFETVVYAINNDFDMIIAHHPLFFKPLKSLRRDTPLGKIVYEAVKNDIVIYSAHTNMDVALGGINDILARTLGLQKTKILKQTHVERLKKLVVYVPYGYEEIVRNAIGDVGAGHIGNYSHCSFNTKGVGTFRPLTSAKPFIGEKGKLEKTDEVRVETIFPKSLQKKVLNAMFRAHPYEEVAFDIYPLENQGDVFGFGRIGYVKKPVKLKEFCDTVKQRLNVSHVRVVGDMNADISKVAVCGGAGGDFAQTAAFFDADVFVTGDLKYHEAVDAKAIGLAIIDAGHFSTENLLLPVLKTYVRRETQILNKEVEISIFKEEDPFVII